MIDAHVHVWRLARGDYDWLTPDLAIHRDYDLDHLRPLVDPGTRVVLVQAAATEAETTFMLETARRSAGLVAGVVGWTDLAAPGAPARIAALAREPLLRGLRPMLQDIADDRWILRSDVQAGLDATAAAGLRLDVLAKPRHLTLLPELARRHPTLAMVIDHAAKPAIAQGAFEPWASDIARVAAEMTAHCKLSGLASEAAADWTTDDLRRYVDHLLACFGPKRLLWGSDWPVVKLAGGYTRWRHAATELVPQPMRDDVFRRTALRFYGLGGPSDQ